MLEKTLTAGNKVRADPQYPVIAVDKDNVPRFLLVKPDGTLDLGGVVIPKFDNFTIQYFGSTNNVRYVIYTLASVEVGRWTFVYAGSGAADNDKLTSGAFTTP